MRRIRNVRQFLFLVSEMLLSLFANKFQCKGKIFYVFSLFYQIY